MQLERSRVSPGVCSQVKLPLFPAAVRNVSLQQGIVTDRGTFWWGGWVLKCHICKGEKGKMHNGACADARPTGGSSLHRCRGFYCSPCVVANYSLKWKCSYSHMKPSAQIRHKSHSLSFCPFNHFQVWVPHFCVLSKHACNIFFFPLSFSSELWKKFENMKLPRFFYHLSDGANRTDVLRKE